MVDAAKHCLFAHFGGFEPAQPNFDAGHYLPAGIWKEVDPSHTQIAGQLAVTDEDVQQRGDHRGSSNLAPTQQVGKYRTRS